MIIKQIDKVRVDRDRWKKRAEKLLEIYNSILSSEYARPPETFKDIDKEINRGLK